MKRLFLFIVFLIALTVYGCATESGNSGGYERPSGHSGHAH